MFMEENLKLRQAQAQQTTKFLGNQLVDAKAKLDEQDARLADFKRRYLGSLPDEEQAILNILTGLTAQLDATTQALNRAQQDRTFTDSMLAQQTANWEAGQNGKNPETLEAELANLQAQLATLKSKYTDNYPDVVRVKNDIAAVEQKIAAETDDVKTLPTEKTVKNSVEPAQMQSMRSQIRQYDQTIKELTARQEGVQQQIKLYEGRVQSSPAIEQQYKELTRDYQTALEFYNDLLKKRDQSAMATDLEQSQQGEQFQVLDPANLPDSPSYPKKLLFSMGGLGGGLGLGVALSLFMELKDTTFRSEKDIEALLHLPVLAMVPAIKLSEGNKAVGPSGLLDRA
jgi:polysaccharide chain length determinant protein (PEP-CTERM system associated)